MSLATKRRDLNANRPYALLPGYSETYSTVCTFVSPAMHARCSLGACGCPCHIKPVTGDLAGKDAVKESR